jgi:hypothetical protein
MEHRTKQQRHQHRAPAARRASDTGPAGASRATRRPWPLIIGLGAIVIAALAALVLALRGPARAAGEVAGSAGQPGGEASTSGFSAVTDCRGFPAFTPEYGFRGGVIINTSLPERMGLVLLDPAQEGKGFQHPSWVKAGNLGPFTADKDGNIYVGPVPRVSLADNPPAGANTIWRVDTQSAEMTPFVELPAAAEPNERNPFGILGMAFDCDTSSIYVSSVAGSGPASEVGRLFQIDSATKQVVSQAEGIDALGIVVANTPEGKRLYYGAARESLIYSIALDERGAFVSEPRLEIDLGDLGGDVNEKARRISLDGDTLKITVVPFTFTLAARSDDLQRHLVARYDTVKQAWVSAGATPTP